MPVTDDEAGLAPLEAFNHITITYASLALRKHTKKGDEERVDKFIIRYEDIETILHCLNVVFDLTLVDLSNKLKDKV